MARKTETQKLQEYADEIWGPGRITITWALNYGFTLRDLSDSPTSRPIGRSAAEAHAELDAMADLKREAYLR